MDSVDLFAKRLFPSAAAFVAKPLRDRLADRAGQLTVVKQVALDQFIHHPFVLFPAFYCVKESIERGLLDADAVRAALAANLSLLLVMLSMVNVGYRAEGRSPFCTAIRYGMLLLRRARQHEGGPLLILGLLLGAVSTVRLGVVLWGTWGYLQAMAA